MNGTPPATQHVGSFRAHADDTPIIEEEIDHFVLHGQGEVREALRMGGEEIEEIPLRHEGDELAAPRQPRESATAIAVATVI